ncbi:hypothetical protein EVAR_95351_1 [Eumeta japonica]|uniref:Uncharacterized protein n=1 Tax=Eumeta variegata TaxID=151549 RepID=A0A4C1U9B4_EUMVA|nr:hypothetical protein EVAR_95351_1 [Eumeta japonica]
MGSGHDRLSDASHAPVSYKNGITTFFMTVNERAGNRKVDDHRRPWTSATLKNRSPLTCSAYYRLPGNKHENGPRQSERRPPEPPATIRRRRRRRVLRKTRAKTWMWVFPNMAHWNIGFPRGDNNHFIRGKHRLGMFKVFPFLNRRHTTLSMRNEFVLMRILILATISHKFSSRSVTRANGGQAVNQNFRQSKPLSILKEDDDVEPQQVFIEPPDLAVLSDEDSADEDQGGFINNLTGRQLGANVNEPQLGPSGNQTSSNRGAGYLNAEVGVVYRSSIDYILPPSEANIGAGDSVLPAKRARAQSRGRPPRREGIQLFYPGTPGCPPHLPPPPSVLATADGNNSPLCIC